MNRNLKPEELFEAVVHVVQLAFKNNPDTQIHRRYRVPNRAGRKREIDVLVETIVGNIDVRIAFECKDLKRKVSAKDVEAFKANCERIPSINKMVMVSRSGYQADAKNAAFEFGIELHQLEELSIEKVQGWFRPNLMQSAEIQTELKEFSVQFVGKAPDLELSLLDIIYPCGLPNGIQLINYVRIVVGKFMATPRPIPLDESKKSASEAIPIKIDCPNSILIIGGNPYNMSRIDATIVCTYRIKDTSISLDGYKSEIDGNTSVQTATISAQDEPAITLVRGSSDSEFDVYISGQKDSFHYASIKIEKRADG